jgi:hypothetical protein
MSNTNLLHLMQTPTGVPGAGGTVLPVGAGGTPGAYVPYGAGG